MGWQAVFKLPAHHFLPRTTFLTPNTHFALRGPQAHFTDYRLPITFFTIPHTAYRLPHTACRLPPKLRLQLRSIVAVIHNP